MSASLERAAQAVTATVRSDVQTIRLTVTDAPRLYVHCWHSTIQPELVELHYTRADGRVTGVHARVEGNLVGDRWQPGDRQDADYTQWDSDWPDWLRTLADNHRPDKENR
ncbi:hypothetical protein ACWY4P_40745 [Streptomyces sp. LZ34]